VSNRKTVIQVMVSLMLVAGCTGYTKKTSQQYYPDAKYQMTDVEYGAFRTIVDRERVMLTYGDLSDTLLAKPLDLIYLTPNGVVENSRKL